MDKYAKKPPHLEERSNNSNAPTTRLPTRQMRNRARVVLVLVAVIFSLANIVKLGHLQLVESEEWQKRAVSQQLSDTVVTAKRGPIYDADMQPLATSADVWKIIMSPKNIAACDWKDLDGVNKEQKLSDDEGLLLLRKTIATDLSEMFKLDYDKVYGQTGKISSQYEVIQSKVEYKEKTAFVEWAEKNGLSKAFYIITDYKRYYPQGSLASTILGFTGTDNNGLEGLEAKYNSVLSGTPGRIITAQNGIGDAMPNSMEYTKVVDPEDGYGLVTTIDATVQMYTEKYLAEAVESTGALHRGVAIVMDVNTGAILAMATKGDYNPNDPFTVTDPTTKELLATLSGNEKAEALYAARQLQWRNKAIADSYEPGSVFKVFTTAMALEEGKASEKTTYECTNSLLVEGWPKPIRCHVYPNKHGVLDLPMAISKSCNPYFMRLGLDIGADTYYTYFSGFGFTEKTGIDMNGEQDNSGTYHSLKTLQDSQASLATASFGQTFQVTPLQMITAMSAVANGGKLMTPYVVSKVLDADGNVISATQPKMKRQIISEETSRRICKILGDIVNGGGSKNAYVAGYRVAGKTGTSEKRTTANEDDVIASFSGFAPADNPQVAVLVLLDDPQTDIRYGGTLSAPVAQKIFESILPHLGVEPSYTEEELSSLSRITPEVTGQTTAVAQNKIVNAGLKATIVGNGDKVVMQVPEAGQTIPAGGTVLLYTDEAEAEMVTVPNFIGLTVTEVNARAAQLGLNVQLTGLVSGSGDAALSNRQSVKEGERVFRGTVIQVNFYYKDTSEN
ncbi:MAG: PASTA domain-containing protein [Clostridia bacterium]|nr:PASTA domain-containing protein [Clostridia bacterium]